MRNEIVILLVLLSLCEAGAAQGFCDLDFSSAQLAAYGQGPAFVSATDAIPGWTGYLGTNQETIVLYNSLSTGDANLAILGTNSPGLIPGNHFTAVLQAGTSPFGGGLYPVSASIAETGLIPATALSLLFSASVPYLVGWQVTIAGDVLPVTEVASINSNFAIYGCDVSAFAGQIAQLEFTAMAGPEPTENLYLDAISFSLFTIPEPSTFGLGILGGAFLAWHHRRTTSQ